MKNIHDLTYVANLNLIFGEGQERSDRTGTGTLSMFGLTAKYNNDTKYGFPLLTTKRVHWKSVVGELLWFLSGSTNANELSNKYGVTIWDEWKDGDGDLGPIYGKQWRSFESYTINKIKVFDKPDQTSIKGTVQGIGSLGDPSIYLGKPLHSELYQTWYGMLKRCYNKNHSAYNQYGGRGIFVDERWLTYSNFYSDCFSLPNWYMKLEYPNEFSLDKDFFGSNKYGPDTCVWSSNIEQSVNNSYNTNFISLTDDSGYKTFHFGLRPLSRMLKRSSMSLSSALKFGNRCAGFLPKKETIPDGHVVRYTNTDQIKKMIALIKHDPFSRRIIVSAWNPNDLNRMSLEPCHTMFQVYVHNNGTLDLQLYQRSADMFLGVPFNIASYSLLMHMIAHVTGYKPGTFIHTLGDVHIYKNHLDAVKTQLSRSLDRESPTLKINPDIKNIFDFKPEDIKLIGYDPYPTIKAPVAV